MTDKEKSNEKEIATIYAENEDGNRVVSALNKGASYTIRAENEGGGSVIGAYATCTGVNSAAIYGNNKGEKGYAIEAVTESVMNKDPALFAVHEGKGPSIWAKSDWGSGNAIKATNKAASTYTIDARNDGGGGTINAVNKGGYTIRAENEGGGTSIVSYITGNKDGVSASCGNNKGEKGYAIEAVTESTKNEDPALFAVHKGKGPSIWAKSDSGSGNAIKATNKGASYTIDARNDGGGGTINAVNKGGYTIRAENEGGGSVIGAYAACTSNYSAAIYGKNKGEKGYAIEAVTESTMNKDPALFAVHKGFGYAIEASSGLNPITIYANNNISCLNCTERSDERLKEAIHPIQKPLESVKKLQGVTYMWKKEKKHPDSDKRQMGLIAQDVEKIFPELVQESKGIKHLAYTPLIAVLIEAVKEQQEQIKKNEERIAHIEKILESR